MDNRISRFGEQSNICAWPTRLSDAVVKETGRGANLAPGRVSITVRVARATAEKLRAWAEGPRKIGEFIDKAFGPLEQVVLTRHATLLISPRVRFAKKEDDWYAIKATH